MLSIAYLRRVFFTVLLTTFTFFDCSPKSQIDITTEKLEIPITLIFPNEDYKKYYYDKLLKRIDRANERYSIIDVQFNVSAISFISDYNLIYDNKTEEREYFANIYPHSIPVFVVDKISNKKRKYSGYAVTHGEICNKYILIRGNNMASEEILTHELGHIMGLGHSTDIKNVMFPYITKTNTKLTKNQKEEARKSAEKYFLSCVTASPQEYKPRQ